MRELFQLHDYIKVNSSDFEQEIGTQNLRFEKPSYDFRYWVKNVQSKEAETFKRWYEGDAIRVDSNEFTVEFPKELADNTDEKIRLFEYIFGDEERRAQLLPLPNNVHDLIDVDVHFVPGSATYNFEGRTIVMRFSTLVQIKGACPPRSGSRLRYGVLFGSSKELEMYTTIYQYLSNPDGVEFFDGKHGHYAIEKTEDDIVRRSKFQLIYGDELRTTLPHLLNEIRYFAPSYTPKEALDYLLHNSHGQYRLFERRFNHGFPGFKLLGKPDEFNFHHSLDASYFDFRMDSKAYSAKDYAESLKNIEASLDKCEIEIEKVKAIRKDRIFSFGDDGNHVEMLFSAQDFKQVRTRLLEEVHIMSQILNAIHLFLEEEAAPITGYSDEIVFEYAYQKITLDPLFYSDDSSADYSKFARMLI